MREFSVSEITSRIKDRLESDGILSNALIRGEISNFKLHSSGHAYFTLKDAGSVIRVVMFRSSFGRVTFRPKDGMEVKVKGRISVYEKDGSYQLYGDFMMAAGQGALAKAYQELKEKLEREGLFDKEVKKPIPYFPRRVGVITSETGAAVRDIIKVLRQRCPIVDIVLYPVQVQGTQSAADIVRALRWFNEREQADVIILGRGGGSIEELWSFNEESVARSIAASEIPIISAVGHETDFTISDFVADLRAATPSNGAELAVPDLEALREQGRSLSFRLEHSVEKDLRKRAERLDWLEHMIHGKMERVLLNKGAGLDRMEGSMDLSIRRRLEAIEKNLVASGNQLDQRMNELSGKKRMEYLLGAERLEALNPERILKLGYSIVELKKKLISSVSELKVEDEVSVKLHDGGFRGRIIEVNRDGD